MCAPRRPGPHLPTSPPTTPQSTMLRSYVWLNEYSSQFLPILGLLALRLVVGAGEWVLRKVGKEKKSEQVRWGGCGCCEKGSACWSSPLPLLLLVACCVSEPVCFSCSVNRRSSLRSWGGTVPRSTMCPWRAPSESPMVAALDAGRLMPGHRWRARPAAWCSTTRRSPSPPLCPRCHRRATGIARRAAGRASRRRRRRARG